MSDLPAVRVSRHPKNPGEFKLFSSMDGDHVTGMAFNCPCGCGRHCVMLFRKSAEDHRVHAYGWDEVEAKPTIFGEIVQRRCGWQGYLLAGVWTHDQPTIAPLGGFA